MIDLSDLPRFTKALAKKVREIELAWRRDYARVVYRTFDNVLIASPQWSGNFVSNWRTAIGKAAVAGSDYTQMPGSDGFGPPLWRGHPVAIAAAKSSAKLPKSIDLEHRVVIYNNTPYGDLIARNEIREDGRTFLRRGNFINPRPIPIGYASITFPSVVREVVR